jgi:hypothetical protein
MPLLANDKMVLLDDEDKKFIKDIGYQEISEYLNLSRDYIRGLCSKGDRYMKNRDLILINKLTEGKS